jgi:hypothetical protein
MFLNVNFIPTNCGVGCQFIVIVGLKGGEGIRGHKRGGGISHMGWKGFYGQGESWQETFCWPPAIIFVGL